MRYLKFHFALSCSIVLIALLAFTKEQQRQLKQLDRVYIEWIDIIATDSGWHSDEEIEEWLRTEGDTVKQMGFIYRQTDSHLILLDSYISGTFVGTATKIPKCNIVKLNKIKQ